jgi:nitroreductase
LTDLFDVIHRQRACRRFSEREVDDETLGRVLDAATFAPSAENRQPWVFVVVRDAETRSRIHDLTEKAWAAGGTDVAAKRVDETLLADVDGGVARGGSPTAPLVLAAPALGLGSALTTLGTAFPSELRELLALPDHVVPQVVVPLGYPAKELGPPRREPFAEHTHRDRYGNPW